MENGLFLPLEVVNREYIGKLLLGVEMAVRGMPVFIGHKKWVIQLALKATEPGILFYKDAGKDEGFMRRLKEKGFGLVAQDEEAGIIYREYVDFYNRRHSLAGIPALDKFYTWGSEEYEFLNNKFYRDRNTNILNTGAIKTVLWGDSGREYFAQHIADIKKRYGRFVIFISNFTELNGYLSQSELAELKVKDRGPDESGRKALYNKQQCLMRLVCEAVETIKNETQMNVLVRPHPV